MFCRFHGNKVKVAQVRIKVLLHKCRIQNLANKSSCEEYSSFQETTEKAKLIQSVWLQCPKQIRNKLRTYSLLAPLAAFLCFAVRNSMSTFDFSTNNSKAQNWSAIMHYYLNTFTTT